MIELLNANSRNIPLADQSVQAIITSPPYFGLRNYNVGGQIGLEESPAEYIASLMQVFAECWRVLRNDGTLWVNLGDSYAGGNGQGGCGPASTKQVSNRGSYLWPIVRSKRTDGGAGTGRWGGGDKKINGLRPKNLIGIPWRVAFALQDAGWYLRSDIIWSKPNPMPESVTDRPTKAHEYIFLLSKRERYFYDADAVREPIAQSTAADHRLDDETYQVGRPERGYPGERQSRGSGLLQPNQAGRNCRTVWECSTNPYSGAHFATWPPALVEPMVKAATSAQACEHCGAPWKRKAVSVREHGLAEIAYPKTQGLEKQNNHKRLHQRLKAARDAGEPHDNALGGRKTIGFYPTCNCRNNAGAGSCIVLDPFAGSGTTLVVARKLGRSAIGLDLSYNYLQNEARNRLSLNALDEWENGIAVSPTDLSDLPLFKTSEVQSD